MEALLPSEIARLILGYLEEENCPEVARMFLESSSLLRECYTVAQRGGKFTRRVNGMTLTNLLEKYCAINALVLERLSKIEDCESLKTSGDILDQLRFLMDGSRGQRFVVNINVPTQNTSQTSGGSPIISSSMRKRRHSGPVDRDRSKKLSKPTSPVLRISESNVRQSCDTVETTPFEQLPGHQNTSEGSGNTQEDYRRVQCSSTSTEPALDSKEVSDNIDIRVSLPEKALTRDNSHRVPEASSQTCETGTDTKELMAFTNTEVQTNPCEAFDTGTEMIDGPVENLSLLTKELLNRTELQERIAQTINRTLIPSDASLRDASFCESTSGECNTSIMRELDHAIKSIVIETETDPVFEQFLLETIGQEIEGEISPDEEEACSPKRKNVPEASAEKNPSLDDIPEKVPDAENQGDHSKNPAIIGDIDTIVKEQVKDAVPLTATDPPVQQDLAALDDVNAAAILSIINVNNTSKELTQEKSTSESEDQESHEISEAPGSLTNSEVRVDSEIPRADSKSKRKRALKQRKEKKPLTPEKDVPEHELVPVPTLIVCSKEEIASMKIPAVRPKSQYVPIMPKTPGMLTQSDPTLYLRAVNVVRSKAVPAAPPLPSCGNSQPLKVPEPVADSHLSKDLATVPESLGLTESITLYGPESGAAVVETDLPSVQLEESMSLTGTGLSPFLKLHRKPEVPQEPNPVDNGVNEENRRLSCQANSDILTKRTPRSIMKSRSRNHRLSLSTPRRRSSHIRALDFNTPTKGLNTSRRLSDADKSCVFSPKSSKGISKACRTSLFKSPSFGGSPSPKRKTKTPSKLCKGKIPIATRSPAPKLIGGWDKITGVGMIIDGTSQSSCPSPVKNSVNSTSVGEVKRPWDSDLRMKVAADVQPVEQKLTKTKERSLRRRKSLRKERIVEGDGIAVSDDEAESAPATLDPKKELLNDKSPDKSLKKPKQEELDEKKGIEVSDQKSEQMEIEVSKKTVEITTKTCAVVSDKVVTKKYAKLKTLTTCVTKVGNNKRGRPCTPGESLDKSSEFGRIDPSKLLDLETPRKFDPNLVPPTPRVLSPSSSMTPFAQISEDSGKIQSFVSTPEFPPTPSINLTPKQSNDSTIDENKKDFGSRYYQPSNESKEARRNSQTGNPMTAILEESVTTRISTQGFQGSTAQLEITQFEVIKENLPKEQAIKELKISRTPDVQINKEENVIESESINKSSKSLESSGTAEDSSDSDSDTSSSSSGSSSSCSSCCDTTNTSSKLSMSRRSRKTPHKVDNSNTNELTVESRVIIDNDTKVGDNEMKMAEVSLEDASKENIDSQKINEESPVKVIPIIKTEDILTAVDLETPAKDEALLAEADISETPSSSKVGIEILTNLNSKISAIIKEDAKPRLSASLVPKAVPKIVSVEKISAAVKVRKMTEEDEDKSIKDAKLARELDEKRLRMINKIKSDNTPRTRAGRSRVSDKGKTREVVRPEQPEDASMKLKNSQPLRKSMRNVEKRATRGLSEPTETITSEKIEPPRKAQSSRDSTGNDEENLEIMILPGINPPINPSGINKLDGILSNAEEERESQNSKRDKDPIVDDKKEETKAKSKVDLVKRDLFSDEENTDGRPADAEPKRQEPQKSESINLAESKQQSEAPGELPGVLESLELVPTNKSFEEASLEEGSYEHIEISFVYDENQPRKKRKKKLNSSDLEMKVQVYTCTGEIVWRHMTSTAHEEIFNLNPPRKKRVNPPKPKVPKEKPVTTVVASKRKGKPRLKNSESVVSEIKGQPLATSSPVSRDDILKAVEKGKASGKMKSEDKVPKHRKRKQSESKDEHSEKKPRMTDPAALLSGININKLLNVVHGSES
ncbi:serine-rich adhesin for platelets-like [Diachasmimorpha longicaudata]|uniref:serine-rich adhesin for platelets-like n=1 Tax=Diachasmimorpha longicaudata TaxID=58733 RepID=UPI0030B89DAB